MAFGTPAAIITAFNSKSGTTLSSTTLIAAAVGDLVVVYVASDNAGTTDATGADNIVSVTDSVGNTYTLAHGYRNGQGSAQAGVHGSVWYTNVTNAMGVGTSITVTSTNTNYARSVAVAKATMAAGSVAQVAGTAAGAGDTGVDPTATISGLTNEGHLWIACGVDETTTPAAAYTGFTRLSVTGSSTSGGSAASNVAMSPQYAVDTASTTKTFTPSMAVDSVAVLVAFREAVPTNVTVTAPPAMVVSVGTFRPPYFSSLTSTAYGTRTDTVINKPAGAETGDWLLATMYSVRSGSAPLIFIPGGWSGSASSINDGTYYANLTYAFRRIDGTEGASFTFGHSGVSYATEIVLALYKNVGGVTAIDAYTDIQFRMATAGSLTGTTLTAASVAHTANSTLVAGSINWNGTGTLNPPTGTTERYDGWVYLSDQELPAAGSTGDRTQTLASVNPWACQTYALTTAGDGSVSVASSTVTTLNPLDKKDGNVALSNGNLTVTGNGSANNWVRSTNARTGKRYVEFTATTVANTIFGIADQSSLTYPGDDAGSFGLFSNGAGSIAGTFPSWLTSYASGNVVCMAVDLDAKLVWWRVGSGNWNGSGTANPATGTGGFSISAYTGTPHFVIVSGDVGSVTTVNFNATAPSGFYAWDGIIPVSVSVNLTAPNALTVSVGDETVAGKATSDATGFGLTASVGTVDFKTDQKLTETGFGLTASVGDATVAAKANITLTGFGLTAGVGDATVSVKANTTLTGFGLTTSTGNATVAAKANTTLTGLSMTAAVGDVTVDEGVAPAVGMAKVWTGSAWAEKPAKVWSGSAWVAKPVKYWDGSAWVTTGGAAPAIEQTGSTLQYSIYNFAGTGTVATNITVPADAELVVVAVSGYHGSSGGGFTGGYTLFTKGGVDTPMVPATGGDSESTWQCAMFTLALPDTGTNKTLKWSWYLGGSPADGHINFSATFWKGIDTASPVRSSGGDQANTGGGWPVVNTPTLTAQAGDKIVAFAGFFRSGANTDGLGEIDTWSNLTEITEIPQEGYAEGAWASGSPTGSTSVGILTATNTSEGGIVAVVLKPAGGAATGPSSSLLATFVPGINRNDFTGEVGVRFGIGPADIPVAWLGVYCRTASGTRTIKLYEWYTDAVLRTVTVDMTGKTVDTWVWTAITPLTLLANGYYSILQAVTASDGLQWSNADVNAIAIGVSSISNLYACYRTPGGSQTAYAPDLMYVGLDLGGS